MGIAREPQTVTATGCRVNWIHKRSADRHFGNAGVIDFIIGAFCLSKRILFLGRLRFFGIGGSDFRFGWLWL